MKVLGIVVSLSGLVIHLTGLHSNNIVYYCLGLIMVFGGLFFYKIIEKSMIDNLILDFLWNNIDEIKEKKNNGN